MNIRCTLKFQLKRQFKNVTSTVYILICYWTNMFETNGIDKRLNLSTHGVYY